MGPVPREAVRGIVIDREDRVLLFRARGDDPSHHFWITPGGGLEPGETASQGLRRELTEECGLRGFVIGPCVWTREHVFPFRGQVLRQRERFYLVRVQTHEVDVSGWDEQERTFMGEHRWWALPDIEVSSEEFAPRDFARYLRDLLEGRVPSEPIDTGV